MGPGSARKNWLQEFEKPVGSQLPNNCGFFRGKTHGALAGKGAMHGESGTEVGLGGGQHIAGRASSVAPGIAEPGAEGCRQTSRMVVSRTHWLLTELRLGVPGLGVTFEEAGATAFKEAQWSCWGLGVA